MKKILLPGVIAALAMLVLGMAVSYLFMLLPAVKADYNNVSLMRPWKDPLMSLFFVYPFFQGIVFAWAWDKTKNIFQGSFAKKGFYFGLAMWLIATVPGMIVSYSSFQLSLLTIISWTVSGLVTSVAAGMVFAKMNR